MTFKQLLRLGDANLLRNVAFRIVDITEKACTDRTNAHAGRLQSVFDTLQTAATHALGGQSRNRVRPTRVVGARCDAVVTADATLRIIANQTVFIVVVSAERAGFHTGRFRTVLALHEKLYRTLGQIGRVAADVGSQPVLAFDVTADHFGIICFDAAYDASLAADTFRRIKKMRKLFFRHLLTPYTRLMRTVTLLLMLPQSAWLLPVANQLVLTPSRTHSYSGRSFLVRTPPEKP